MTEELKQIVGKIADNLTKKEPFIDKVEEKPKLKCPQCKARLPYLIVRTMFFIGTKDGQPHYQTGTEFNCPFCGHGIAGNEDLAIERLKTGKFGYTTKQFEKLVKEKRKNAETQTVP